MDKASGFPGKLSPLQALGGAQRAARLPALAAPGPGIGNVDCTEAEAFEPLSFLENKEGGPTGSNVVIMTGGYLKLDYANGSVGPPPADPLAPE